MPEMCTEAVAFMLSLFVFREISFADLSERFPLPDSTFGNVFPCERLK